MIHTSRTVTVGKMESVINEPIMLYRGDREVEIEFNIVGSKFMFSNGGNVIKSTNATNGQLVINTPTGENMFSEVTECNDGKVVCVITKEMIDELAEVGFYSFQIRLFDESQVSRVTIPPVYQGIEIRNPIAAEDETDLVDIGLVDFSVVRKDNYENVVTFLPNGDYNKTLWEEHDVISKDRLNKVEDALYEINKGTEGLYPTFQNQYDEFSAKVNKDVKAYKEEMEDEVEQFERDMTQAFGEFKVDYRDDMHDRMDVVEGELDVVEGELEQTTNKVDKYIYLDNFLNGDELDYSDVLQEAINESKKTRQPIFIGGGTFPFSKTLQMYNYVKIKGIGDGTVLNYTGTDIAFNCIDISNTYSEKWNYGIYNMEINDLILRGTNKTGTGVKGEFRYCNFNNLTISDFDTLVDLTNDWTINFYNCDFRNSNITIKLGIQNNAINFIGCKVSNTEYFLYGLQCYKIGFTNGNIESVSKAIIQASNPTWSRLHAISITNSYLENTGSLIDLTDIEAFSLIGFRLSNCIVNVVTTNYFLDTSKIVDALYNSCIDNNMFYQLKGDYSLFNLNSCVVEFRNNSYYYYNEVSNSVSITKPFTDITYKSSGVQIVTIRSKGAISTNFIGSSKGLVLATEPTPVAKPNACLTYNTTTNNMEVYIDGQTRYFQEIISGPTEERPTAYLGKKGYMFFDTTLNKPIWYYHRDDNGINKWKDANGNNV